MASRLNLSQTVAVCLTLSCLTGPANARETAVTVPVPLTDEAPKSDAALEHAVLAGGCFWGVQGVYQHVKGVTKVLAGYAGGAESTAHYMMVGSGTTGHAESVDITYDPGKISYGKLLQIFFSVVHNPTELNRQGPDSGSQYRSAVFPQNAEQKQIALDYIAQIKAAKTFALPVVTTVEEAKTFFAAEDYHQDYLTLNPYNPYIAINDIPKVQNLAQTFPQIYRDKPVLVKDR